MEQAIWNHHFAAWFLPGVNIEPFTFPASLSRFKRNG